MRKSLVFLSAILLLGCQNSTPVETTGLPTVDEMQPTAEMTAANEKYYEDEALSFNYPKDLLIYKTSHGEGSLGYELTFIQLDGNGYYISAGPVIAVEESESSPTHEEKYNQDLKEAGQSVLVLDFPGAQAFEVSVTNDFNGESYRTLEAISDNSSYDPTSYDLTNPTQYFSPFYFVTFSPLESSNNRYHEILNMFEKTVQFK